MLSRRKALDRHGIIVLNFIVLSSRGYPLPNYRSLLGCYTPGGMASFVVTVECALTLASSQVFSL